MGQREGNSCSALDCERVDVHASDHISFALVTMRSLCAWLRIALLAGAACSTLAHGQTQTHTSAAAHRTHRLCRKRRSSRSLSRVWSAALDLASLSPVVSFPPPYSEYLGCYKDLFAASDRDLLGSLLLNDNNANLITPDHCEEYCGRKQFKYVGSD